MFLFVALTLAQAPDDRFVLSGRAPRALPELRGALEADPEDREVWARMGVLLSRAGEPALALGYLEDAEDAAFYQAHGAGPHADALLAYGDGRGAWEVRSLRLLEDRSESADSLTLCLGAQDLLLVGDVAGAEALAERALALTPRSGFALSTLAQVQMAEGRLDEAEATLWLAGFWGSSAAIDERLEGELALLRGDPVVGEMALSESAGGRMYRHTVDARARFLRAQGRPWDALALLDRRSLVRVRTPEVLAERTLALHEAGLHDHAEQECFELTHLFPEHPLASWIPAAIGEACR